MSVFRRRRQSNGEEAGASYRFRINTRKELLDKADLVLVDDGKGEMNEQNRLARVLEEVAGDGWRLIGVSDQDFIFRRRR